MKIKNHKEKNGFVNVNFTGILEYCDGLYGHLISCIFYCKNGKLHRENGPARCWHDGTKEWYLNGLFHREDGPAIENADGSKFWYLHNRFFSEKEWKIEVEKLKKDSKIVSK